MSNETKRRTIKDEELENELKAFECWLGKQINKTLYRKFRIKKLLKQTYRNEIRKKLKTILTTQIGKLPKDLTKQDIEKWEEACYSKYMNNGNLGRFQAINYLLTYLGHEDWQLKLPVVDEFRYPTMREDERTRYLDTLNKNCENILYKDASELTLREMKHIMDRAVALTQMMSESRPSEVCIIETKDVDFEQHKITLSDSKTHELIIRRSMDDALLMTPQIEEAIRDWLKIRNHIHPKKQEDEKYLFIYPYGRYKGEAIGYNKLLRLCKEIGIEAGITRITTTPYCLKRTEITRDCDRTNNLRIPQIRARHTDFKSTMRYNQKQTKDAIEYIHSDKYGDVGLPLEIQKQKLAEKAIKGEIPLDVWEKLRADLEINKIERKKNEFLGYG
jgi:integrase